MGIEEMDERKLKHDYIRSVQIVKIFVQMTVRGKLDFASTEGLEIIEEVRSSIAFLENYPDIADSKKSESP